MNPRITIAVLATVLVIVFMVVFAVTNRPAPLVDANPDYNPQYAQAIERKDPALCKNIKFALQSSPTDQLTKVEGDRAVTICESQARAGFIGCECDANALLDSMKEID